MRSAVNAMIKSKRFKAILKIKRQFILLDRPPNAAKTAFFQTLDEPARGLTNSDWIETYLNRHHPERIHQFERISFFLDMYSMGKEWRHAAICYRYNLLIFLSTVNDVIKALEPYPNVAFNSKTYNIQISSYIPENKCANEVYRSPLIKNYRKTNPPRVRTFLMYDEVDRTKRRSAVTAVMTPDFFKVIDGEMEIRKFEVILGWIACLTIKLNKYSEILDRADLINFRDTTKRELKFAYRNDSVSFNLVNQAARLLMH